MPIKKLQEEKIIEIAKKEGVFTVTWRYRDDWIRNMCDKLYKKKLFYKVSKSGVDYYYPTDKLLSLT